jgi:uncharacterized membrane protein YkoI
MDRSGDDLAGLPETVREAAQRAVPGIHLTEMEVKGSESGMMYEVEGHADGKRYEIKVDAGGEVLDVELESKDEEMVFLSEVPEVVIEAAKRKLPDIELKSAEVEEHRSGRVYELEGVVNGLVYELEITDSGDVIEVESESEENEDED